MNRDPAAVRDRWRGASGAVPARRRGVAALSLLAAGSMGVVASYQLGLIRRLPDPPLAGFDSAKVAGSAEAYALLGMPDAVLGLGSYAATLGLAALGGGDRSPARPWLPLALAAKVSLDATLAGRKALGQWPRHRALCSWCLVAAGASLASVPLVLPDAIEALRRRETCPGRWPADDRRSRRVAARSGRTEGETWIGLWMN